MIDEDRPYQTDALGNVSNEMAAGHKAVLLVAPCGAGKTRIAGMMIEKTVARGKRVVFGAARRELVAQCSRRLTAIGVDHGIIAASMGGYKPQCSTQVVSIQTLRARPDERPPCDLLVLDEASHARAGSYETLRQAYPNAYCVGLTATPIRMDGRGLGEIFTSMVTAAVPSELVRAGWLARAGGYAYQTADVRDVEMVGADFNQAQLGAKMHDSRILGDIVAEWKAHASRLLTVCFAVHREHSREIVEAFTAAGVKAEHVDGEMSTQQREAVLARWESGVTRVVSNVDLISEGFDLPKIGCTILARPTQSLALFIQQSGRALRPACFACGRATSPLLPTCQHCGSTDVKRIGRIHDHAGNCQRHGLPDADRAWTLERDGEVKDPEEKALGVRTCKRCFGCYRPTLPTCPYCGFRNPRVLREIRTADGVAVPLEEIERRRAAAAEAEKFKGPVVTSDENKRGHYFQLKRIQIEKDHKPGWVGIVFKSKYGNWPPVEWASDFPEWYSRWKASHPDQYATTEAAT